MKGLPPVPDEVAAQITAKRDEYKRLTKDGVRPLGKSASKPKVIEYAMQLLCWMDDNMKDPAVASIMDRFVYRTNITRRGRPSKTAEQRVDDINSSTMDIIMKRFRSFGINSPTHEEILEQYFLIKNDNPQELGKANREAEEKMKALRRDPSLIKLEDELDRIEKEKPAKNNNWFTDPHPKFKDRTDD